MATINTNMAANIAANSLTRNERSMGQTMERLSTGIRINSAKDDAAGQAIAEHAGAIVTNLDGKLFKYGKEDYRNPTILIRRSKKLNV